MRKIATCLMLLCFTGNVFAISQRQKDFKVPCNKEVCRQERILKTHSWLVKLVSIKEWLKVVYEVGEESKPRWSEPHPKAKSWENLNPAPLPKEPVKFLPKGHLARLNKRGWLDQVLSRDDARYQTFGPNGKRLDMRRLEAGRLGICGDFGYIHRQKGDLFEIFLKINHKPAKPQLKRVKWFPSQFVAYFTADKIEIEERKWISNNDVAVSWLQIKNHSQQKIFIEIEARSPLVKKEANTQIKFFKIPVKIYFNGRCKNSYGRKFSFWLDKDEEKECIFALAFSLEKEQSPQKKAEFWLSTSEPSKIQQKQYLDWYSQNAVYFDCPEPHWKRLWYYRYYLLRRNLVEPAVRCLRYPCFYEGIYDRSPSAWRHWFDQVITFSSPHIIAETRWLRNSRYAFGQVFTHFDSQAGDGIFYCAKIYGATGTLYTEWIASSAYQAWLVHPERGYLEKIIPYLEANVLGVLKKYDHDGDWLVRAPNFALTGMEWQPAFWYFHNYNNTRNPTTLERPAFTSYLYANLIALTQALEITGRKEEAEKYRQLAKKVQKAILEKMWNDKDEFFYSLRERDDKPARVKEIVGFYPFAFKVVPLSKNKYCSAFKYLTDPEEFWQRIPLATVSKKCPAYTPHIQTWPAKGGITTSCMWNGPTWPHANSIIAMALANDLRFYHSGYISFQDFYRFLDLFTWLHYEDSEAKKPLILEYYDGENGAGYGCLDYLHSTYIDLLINYVAGLVPRADNKIELWPLIKNWDYFAFDGIPYHNYELTIVWQKPKSKRYPDLPAGYSLYVDGRLIFNQPILGHYLIDPQKPSFKMLEE